MWLWCVCVWKLDTHKKLHRERKKRKRKHNESKREREAHTLAIRQTFQCLTLTSQLVMCVRMCACMFAYMLECLFNRLTVCSDVVKRVNMRVQMRTVTCRHPHIQHFLVIVCLSVHKSIQTHKHLSLQRGFRKRTLHVWMRIMYKYDSVCVCVREYTCMHKHTYTNSTYVLM